jgi:hypothetical protein
LREARVAYRGTHRAAFDASSPQTAFLEEGRVVPTAPPNIFTGFKVVSAFGTAVSPGFRYS